MGSKRDKKKVEELIAKGDELEKKGKHKSALKKYLKAQKHDPERPEIYDKLVETHEKATKDWTEGDVADSVGWVMEKQKIENPAMKLLYERLTPEWREITDKISKLIICDTDEDECKAIEEIKAYGIDAVYPLIYILLQIKKGSKTCQEKGKE